MPVVNVTRPLNTSAMAISVSSRYVNMTDTINWVSDERPEERVTEAGCTHFK